MKQPPTRVMAQMARQLRGKLILIARWEEARFVVPVTRTLSSSPARQDPANSHPFGFTAEKRQ